MIIRCDACGREIERVDALSFETGEQVLYFCCDECLERGADLDALEPTGGSSREEPRGLVVTGDED